MLHYDEFGAGEVRKAFALSPDHVNTLAFRIMPLGKHITACTVSKVL